MSDNKDTVASIMKANNPQIEPFRSRGFVNRTCDMARVYIDLPIIEAKILLGKIKGTS